MLLGGDWQTLSGRRWWWSRRSRPYTMAPAWAAWEPLLAEHGYRFVLFDSLNRYYVAEEHA